MVNYLINFQLKSTEFYRCIKLENNRILFKQLLHVILFISYLDHPLLFIVVSYDLPCERNCSWNANELELNK